MHRDTSVFVRKGEVSENLGKKTAVHVHFSGIWRPKWTNPKANCFPCMEFYCFPRKMSTRRWILEPKMSGFGPQMGIACAFKSDLKGKVDESKGTLLPMRGLLLFFQAKWASGVGLGAHARGRLPKSPRCNLRISYVKLRFFEFYQRIGDPLRPIPS